MATVLLVRHGRTPANGAGVLAGWTPDIHLDDTGRAQAAGLAARLAGLPLAAVVSSPLERCQETAALLVAGRGDVPVVADERFGECRYGAWTGREVRTLAKDPLWRTVQAHPSAVTFPGDGGESLRETQARAVTALREWNDRLGPDALYAVVSHGDVIKALLADALGLHLDGFQRIVVDPGSLSAVRYTPLRPFVLRINDTGGDLQGLRPARRRRRRLAVPESDAVVGGGPGA